MILYCYNSAGAYVGPVSAPLSPARPFIDGRPNYLRPAGTTDQAPPPAEPGRAARFDGQAWVLAEDHRGSLIFDTSTRLPRIADSLGPVPEGFTLNAPPSDCHVWDGQAWQADLALQLAALRRERNVRLADTDWTQMPDVNMPDETRQAWRAYRQALRDLTENWTPETPWPALPTE